MSDCSPQLVADWMMKPGEHGGDEVTDIEVGIRHHKLYKALSLWSGIP